MPIEAIIGLCLAFFSIYERQYADIIYCFRADIGDYITAILYMHSALHRAARLSRGATGAPLFFIRRASISLKTPVGLQNKELLRRRYDTRIVCL